MPTRPQAVLLVDDSQNEITLVSFELLPFNVTFKGVTDQDETIQLLHTDWYDVCLIDQYMPKILGIELARLILSPKQNRPPLNKNVQLYIFTAYPDPSTLLEATKMNCPLIWKAKMRQMFAFLFELKPLN